MCATYKFRHSGKITKKAQKTNYNFFPQIVVGTKSQYYMKCGHKHILTIQAAHKHRSFVWYGAARALT